MDSLIVYPLEQPFHLAFRPPGSKSLTNRALVLAACGKGSCLLTNALFADDSRVMIDGLRALGFPLEVDEPQKTIRVQGMNGQIPSPTAQLACGNSGTTIRFLTALCALGRGTYQLDGVARMRQRPIGPLVTMLRNLGVRVSHAMDDGFPPVVVQADTLPGGIVQYGSETSSQYLSAVLQVAPYARNEVFVDLVGPQTSWPYVAMTMQLMDHFGVTCEIERDPDTREPRRIIVPPHAYQCDRYDIEPDASNATYSLALAALHRGARVEVQGLGRSSLQGDVGFAAILGRMGAKIAIDRLSITVEGTGRLTGIDVNLAEMPDTAQTLAVVALFAHSPSVLRGLHTLRVKETDRLAALQTELTRLGAKVDIADDTLTVHPPASITPASIDTYDDHRMAMSFALAGSRAAGVRINDPACVNKTYPNYFDDLARFGVQTSK